MASVKVKFRASTVDKKPGGVYFQIIQNRTADDVITAIQIHKRPRKKLNYSNPKEEFYKHYS